MLAGPTERQLISRSASESAAGGVPASRARVAASASVGASSISARRTVEARTATVGSWGLIEKLPGSAQTDQLDMEDQRRVGRNHGRIAAGAIGQLRRNHELALAADPHAAHPAVPALDHVARHLAD